MPGRACPRGAGACLCSALEGAAGCPEACAWEEGCPSCRGAQEPEAGGGPGLAAASAERTEARLAGLEAECAGVRGLGRGLAQLQEEVAVLRQAQLDTQVEAPCTISLYMILYMIQ